MKTKDDLTMKSLLAFVAALAFAGGAIAADSDASGAKLYETTCAVCHGAGVAGAPKFGDSAAWAPLIDSGMDAMMDVAINGKGAMPPRGGSSASDDELRAAVEYMVAAAESGAEGGDAAPAAEATPAADAAQAPAQEDDADDGSIDVAAGQELYTATCAACHGPDGNSSVPSQPHLAQQHPEYLVKQLVEFKSGARASDIMVGFAGMLSESQARNIAWWLASQKAKPGFASDADLAAMGERIYRGGLADRHIPACSGCHSPNGVGMPAQYPRLAGQLVEYTEAELFAFRDNERANSEVMHEITRYMTAQEIRAVSDYIAGLR